MISILYVWILFVKSILSKMEMPDRKTPKEITTLTYIKTFDRFAGGGLTENSIGALVVFEMEDGHRLSVELDKIDGKWYYDGLN